MMNDIKEILTSVWEKKNSAFFYTPLKTGNEISYIFGTPAKSIVCGSKDNLKEKLELIDSLSREYKYAFGYISYEAGYLLEDKLKSLVKSVDEVILRFFFFDTSSVQKISSNNIEFKNIETLIKDKNYEIKESVLNVSREEFEKNIKKIKELIKQGDTYQVNYTVKTKFKFEGYLVPFVANLIFNQSANYTAFINDDERFLISLSPELFFKTDKKNIIVKPMKGTIKRGFNIENDIVKRNNLYNSSKDRAENIMIVDLLRNDLGKICEFNSVNADSLFNVEKYETLHQMTSQVSGVLKEKSFKKIIENLFPCGSITGAPKIRTMEIIKELEIEQRNVYTGTIGIIENGDFNFNIPIRTISINPDSHKGEIGIGSGVVWDSNPKSEFEETKLKSNFLVKQNNYFELIETMLIENGDIFLLENHVARLKKSAEYFLFIFNEKEFRETIQSIVKTINREQKFKLKTLLTKWGEVKYSIQRFDDLTINGSIVVSNKRVNSKDQFQYFKTTNRELYNSEFNKWSGKGFTDVIFLNEKEEVTEGAISNIMIKKDDNYYTPPINAGLLNGCYREFLLETERNIYERVLFLEDLFEADAIFIINSVRKITRVKLFTERF